MEIKKITQEELKQRIDRNDDCTIIDVRNPKAYAESPYIIKGAVRIGMDELESKIKDLPKDKTMVTYCT